MHVEHGDEGELGEGFSSSWGVARQILPLLFAGVLVAGALLGRPGHEGLMPSAWVAAAVGGNSLEANLFASVAGAFMYFATLTEVPILEGLLDNGMGQGPALALLLAGPAVSLPNMLVVASVIGWRKTVAFVSLVVVMATVSGLIDYKLEKVTDVAKFADYGVMMTPGLVVDGEVKSQGKVLSLEEIKATLA